MGLEGGECAVLYNFRISYPLNAICIHVTTLTFVYLFTFLSHSGTLEVTYGDIFPLSCALLWLSGEACAKRQNKPLGVETDSLAAERFFDSCEKPPAVARRAIRS